VNKVKRVVFKEPVREPVDGTPSEQGGELLAYGFGSTEACSVFEDGNELLVISKGGIVHRVPKENIRWYRRSESPKK
jgi:hypothetical protein